MRGMHLSFFFFIQNKKSLKTFTNPKINKILKTMVTWGDAETDFLVRERR
jgi:hypothetical protein